MNLDIKKGQAELLWKICLEYLEKKTDINDVMDLASNKTNQLLTKMPAIYKKLLQSLPNRQGMKNSIGDIDRLSTVLSKFNPKMVCLNYKSWEELFNKIKREIRPTSRMEPSVPQNFWVVFCKGAIDAAIFLSKFKDGYEFNAKIELFAQNEPFIAGLPEVLKIEITGFGFPLACDFLKEAGWSQYAKADTHTKKILAAIGFSDGEDYITFKSIRQIALHVNETPYRVDKVLWLIGSGDLYNKNKTFKTSRDEFVNYWKSKNG